jgi:hypothetical protein
MFGVSFAACRLRGMLVQLEGTDGALEYRSRTKTSFCGISTSWTITRSSRLPARALSSGFKCAYVCSIRAGEPVVMVGSCAEGTLE